MSADAPEPAESTAPPSVMQGVVTKAAYDELKRKLEEHEAGAARLARYDKMNRETLLAMQPVVQELVEQEIKDNPEHSELKDVSEWAKELSSCPESKIGASLGIARLISCNSARIKRTRDEASASAETSTLLAETMKKLEACEAERDLLQLRNKEYDAELKLMQVNVRKLDQINQMNAKYDFSKASSREAGENESSSATGSSSKPVATDVDSLFAYVSSNGSGSGRIDQSGSQHHLLGRGTGSSMDIAALVAGRA